MEKSLLMSAKSLSEALDISIHTIKRMVRDGVFPAPVRIGNLLYWRRSEVDDFIEKLDGSKERFRKKPDGGREVKATPESIEFLKGALMYGPRLSEEIYEEGERLGLDKETLKAAKKAIGAKGALKGKGKWEWFL